MLEKQLADQAWLNLSEGDLKDLKNDLKVAIRDPDKIAQDVVRFMRNPDNFFFTCKYIFDFELLPYQAVVLKELWNHQFSMLIAARGGAKTSLLGLYSWLRCLFIPNTKVVLTGAAFRQSKLIFEVMEKLWNGSPVLRNLVSGGPRRDVDRCTFRVNDSSAIAIPIGCTLGETLITTNQGIRELKQLKNYIGQVWSNNKFQDVGYFYNNGISPTKKIITKRGYQFISTPNHKIKIVRNNQIIWCRVDEMKIGDNILLDRTERWYNPSFKCTNDQAYVLGCMIGDGSYVNKYRLTFATKDYEFLCYLNQEFGLNKKRYDSSDELHYYYCGKERTENWMNFWGLNYTYTPDKTLPDNLLSAPKSAVAACLSGLYDTDGHIFVTNYKGGLQCSIGFTNTSKKLIDQMRFILLHFGIITSLSSRRRKVPSGKKLGLECYELYIYGEDVLKFYNYINFRLSRKRKKLEYVIKNKKRWNSINGNHIPISKDYLKEICKDYKLGQEFCPKHLNERKSLTLKYVTKFYNRCLEKNVNLKKLYILKELINPNLYFDTIIDIQNGLDLPTYDINVPKNNTYNANGFISHNTGEKIRGLRANCLVCDEFSSTDVSIYETVLSGFASVTQDPVHNVKLVAKKRFLKEIGQWNEKMEDQYKIKHNQSIIAGTADYSFGHFYEYWNRYHQIIQSKGNSDKLKDLFGENVPEEMDWKDYCIMRFPYDILPKGMLDIKHIARAKATMDSGNFNNEFMSIFSSDSTGFFRMSLIDQCIGTDLKPIKLSGGEEVYFDVSLSGKPKVKYIIGIDPASERDNFTICVLELQKTHRRIVYLWSTNRSDFQKKQKAKLTEEHNFYVYCARKIRDLMKNFNIVRIGMDSQGGGVQIEEGLHDPKNLEQGESLIWRDDNEFIGKAGLKILELVNFAKADWTREANHGMKKDMETQTLLFPRFDPVTLGLALEADKGRKEKDRLYDSLEDVLFEMEELKNELTTIILTKTSKEGRERWDTPETKLSGGRKGRMKKDRYSALLIANMIARQYQMVEPATSWEIGGRSKDIRRKVKNEKLYQGADWYTLDSNMCYRIRK